MQAQLRELIARHCKTMVAEFNDVLECLDRLDDPALSQSAIIAQGIELAHKIKGSSGSLGFAHISAAAASLEAHLKALAAEETELEQEARGSLQRYLKELEDYVLHVSPEDSALWHVSLDGM